MTELGDRELYRLRLLVRKPLQELERELECPLPWKTWNELTLALSVVAEVRRELFDCTECLKCRESSCRAWVKIFCGGCKNKWWIFQSQLVGSTWCLTCDWHWRRANPLRALRQFIQIPGGREIPDREAVSLVENLEQRRNWALAWEFQHQLHRITSQNQTVILTTLCKKGIHVPLVWQVRPDEWNTTIRRYSRVHKQQKRKERREERRNSRKLREKGIKTEGEP